MPEIDLAPTDAMNELLNDGDVPRINIDMLRHPEELENIHLPPVNNVINAKFNKNQSNVTCFHCGKKGHCATNSRFFLNNSNSNPSNGFPQTKWKQ